MRFALSLAGLVLAIMPPPFPIADDEQGCWWPPGQILNEDRQHFPGGLEHISRFVDRFPVVQCGRLVDGHPDVDR